MKIMFVCTGNTCRSSMAAGLAAAQLKERGRSDISILSAGTMAWPGDPAAPQAIEVLSAKGIDITQHRATPLDGQLAEQADLILTMTAGHKQQVQSLYPAAAHKTFTLKEYVGAEGDISDPFGQAVEIYQACAEELAQLIAKALDKLLQDKAGEQQ